MNIKVQQRDIKSLAYILLFIIIYLLIKTTFTDLSLYKTLQITMSRAIFVSLSMLKEGLIIDTTNGNYIYQNTTITTASSLAIKYYFIVFGILILAVRERKRTLTVLVVAFLALYLSNVLKYVNDLLSPADFKGFLYWVNVSFRYLIIYFVVKFKIGLHQTSRNAYAKFNEAIQQVFQITLHRLLILICMVPAFAAFFDWFLVGKWTGFVDGLSSIILGLSEWMLHLLGHNTAYVTNKTVYLSNYWLILGPNCMGVGLMVVFAALIYSIKSPLINRLVFIPLGIAFIILLNAIRINAILLHIVRNETPQHLIEDYHNLSNNIYYVIVFVFILTYITWFQNIKFRKPKTQSIEVGKS